MQPAQPTHGTGIAGIPGAELGIPLLQNQRRAQTAKAAIIAATMAKARCPVIGKATVPMTPAMLNIRKCTLNMPRNSRATSGISSFTSRKAGDARKK